MVKILIYIISDGEEKSDKYFDPKYFDVNYVKDIEDNDKNTYFRLLEKSKKEHEKSYTLIMKSNMISISDKDQVKSIIYDIKKHNFDLIYLFKHSDKCGMMNKIKGSKYLYRTYSPMGTDALFFSPVGRDRILGIINTRLEKILSNYTGSLCYILNRAIYSGDLKALCLSPNLFTPDISTVTNHIDFVKYNECSDIVNVADDNNSKLVVISSVLILGVFVFWFALKKNENDDKKKKL